MPESRAMSQSDFCEWPTLCRKGSVYVSSPVFQGIGSNGVVVLLERTFVVVERAERSVMLSGLFVPRSESIGRINGSGCVGVTCFHFFGSEVCGE